ncbi:hypothetical protein PoB_004273400 [Plakobranchus ocellatus]|uniref:Uncharacterized protein n=1 Tax=Plakobranchus ocellatus TaxID=259542 RepID=A0AAV4BCX9_9GAST|nr:hypothetical protein PoB_004273400 [Plakobranchus ocellatus]
MRLMMLNVSLAKRHQQGNCLTDPSPPSGNDGLLDASVPPASSSGQISIRHGSDRPCVSGSSRSASGMASGYLVRIRLCRTHAHMAIRLMLSGFCSIVVKKQRNL